MKHRVVSFIYTFINSFLFKRSRVKYASFAINGVIKIFNNGNIEIGNNFQANSGKNKNPIGGDTVLRLIAFKPGAQLIIGNNVGISNSTIVCWDKIEIGNNVIIGGSCKIWDTNFHSTDAVKRQIKPDNDVRTMAVYIKDNVFIGANAIINKGVTIGENSIIAAGSVVVKSIPANVIAGGNPCKVIKEIAA